jgi:hypothetical protein
MRTLLLSLAVGLTTLTPIGFAAMRPHVMARSAMMPQMAHTAARGTPRHVASTMHTGRGHGHPGGKTVRANNGKKAHKGRAHTRSSHRQGRAPRAGRAR